MRNVEAEAFIDGFCAGGVFFAASFETHQQRRDVFNRIKAELREAQAAVRLGASEPHAGNEDGSYLPGSCAHCGQFHSSAVCPPTNPQQPTK